MATPATDSSVLTRRGMLTATASSLLLSACGQAQPQDEAEPDGSASPSGPELLIGVSLELTGRGAALGVLQERALRITLEDLNVDRVQVGNQRRSVRVLVRDNRSDPRLAAQQATELIREDRVHALLGTTLRELVFRYIHEYGGFSGFAPYASDALQLVANAARLGSSVDRGRLRAYLQTQVTEGMAGWYALAPIRHGGMERDSLGVYQLTQGGWARVS